MREYKFIKSVMSILVMSMIFLSMSAHSNDGVPFDGVQKSEAILFVALPAMVAVENHSHEATKNFTDQTDTKVPIEPLSLVGATVDLSGGVADSYLIDQLNSDNSLLNLSAVKPIDTGGKAEVGWRRS